MTTPTQPIEEFTSLSISNSRLPPITNPTPTTPASASMDTPNPLPPWARQKHRIETPRLILRGAVPDDAEAFAKVMRDPVNSPFGGVVGRERSLEEQRQSLIKQQESTARGENAWLVVILKPGQEELISKSNLSPDQLSALSVPEGHLIGSTGYNEFVLSSASPQTLSTDTGALIHHPFTHHGLAMETLQAVISYAFAELGVDIMTLETDAVNAPFRGLMGSLGLGHTERPGSNGPDPEKEEKISDPLAPTTTSTSTSTTPLPAAKVLGGRNHPLAPKPGPKTHIKQGALLPAEFQPTSDPKPKEAKEEKPKQDNGLGSNPSVKFSFGLPEWEIAKTGLKERGRWYLD